MPDEQSIPIDTHVGDTIISVNAALVMPTPGSPYPDAVISVVLPENTQALLESPGGVGYAALAAFYANGGTLRFTLPLARLIEVSNETLQGTKAAGGGAR